MILLQSSLFSTNSIFFLKLAPLRMLNLFLLQKGFIYWLAILYKDLVSLTSSNIAKYQSQSYSRFFQASLMLLAKSYEKNIKCADSLQLFTKIMNVV